MRVMGLRRPDPRRHPGNHALPPALRGDERSAASATGVDGLRSPVLARVEAALFLADEPLTPRRLVAIVGLGGVAEARQHIAALRNRYEADNSAFQIEERAGGYQLLTRPEYHPWLIRLRRQQTEGRLTKALLEILTIIAYRQPITRADIEAIRGVHCGEPLRQLMEKGLVRIAGRDDSLGRPVLYGTTRKFLQDFGLNSLDDLPEIESDRRPPSGS